MHTFTVALRISGRSLDAIKATKDLGITPTQTRIAGERRGANSTWDETMWEWETHPDNGGDWHSLEQGLAVLLNVFIPKRETLQKYRQEHSVYIWCGHFSSSFDDGPRFSAELLKSLGDFGTEFWIDTYFHSETP